MVYPNADPLVIKAKIMGVTVHRLLVDSGAFYNVLFKYTLDKMGNFPDYVEPCEHVMKGFGKATMKPYGIIFLAVELVLTSDEILGPPNFMIFL